MVKVVPGAGLSEKIRAILNKGGAMLASLLGMPAPRTLGRLFRMNLEQVDQTADLAYREGLAAYRKRVGVPPNNEVDSWNRDLDKVVLDINASFNNKVMNINVPTRKFPSGRF